MAELLVAEKVVKKEPKKAFQTEEKLLGLESEPT